jgi:predicted nucleotidyltransferase
MPLTRILDDPILKRFRAALDRLYGDRIERVVLFGSRARGDAHEDSDYDIAVFIRDPEAFSKEADRLADVETDYGVGSTMPQITAEDAAAALETAGQFIDRIAALLA